MANSITFTYTPPTQNTDGSPAKAVSKYQIGWDTKSHPTGDYPNIVDDIDFTPNQAGSQQTIIVLPAPGTYFAAARDTTLDGTSGWSPEVSKTLVQAPPNAPGNFGAA